MQYAGSHIFLLKTFLQPPVLELLRFNTLNTRLSTFENAFIRGFVNFPFNFYFLFQFQFFMYVYMFYVKKLRVKLRFIKRLFLPGYADFSGAKKNWRLSLYVIVPFELLTMLSLVRDSW